MSVSLTQIQNQITFAQKGVRGLTGPQGIQGIQGEQGIQGIPGDWGDIGGTLSNQVDLQSALDGKMEPGDSISTLTNDSNFTSNGEDVILTALGDGDKFSSDDGTYKVPPQSGTTTMRAEAGITGPPSDGRVRWSNATQINATQLFMSEKNAEGDDLQNYLSALEINDGIYLQNSGDAGQYQSWNIAGITDSGTYKTLDVGLLQSAGGNFSTSGQGQSLLMTIKKGAAAVSQLQQAQTEIATSPTIESVKPEDYFTFYDASEANIRITQYRNIYGDRVVVNTLSDLDDFLNAGVYELPANVYEFNGDINFGTSRILLTEANKTYFLCGVALPTVTYTGSSSFITTSQTGVSLKLFGLFFTTPSSTCVDLANGNSFIADFAGWVGCQKAANIDTFAFISYSTVLVIACGDGTTADSVGSINMRFPQFNNNTNTGGCFIRALGASSERLIATTIDARPESTECFIDIDATYGGDIAMGTGVMKTGGGTFFSGSGRDQSDVDVDVQGIKNVTNSKVFANAHFDGNTLDTVVSAIDTPAKINAGGGGWTDVGRSRFNFDSSGRWTYIGKETITKFTILAATVDPVGGGTKDVSIYLAKNGTIIATSRGEASASAGSQIVSFANIPLATNDYVECFVENNTDAADILVRNASFDDT